MPFKSKAQMRAFAEKVKMGEISQATFDEWRRATNFSQLPERVTPKRKGASKVLTVKSAKVIK